MSALKPSVAGQQRRASWNVFSFLRVRLLLMVLIGMVPIVVLVLYSTFKQRRTAVDETQQEALRVARIVARTQQQNLEATRQLLVILAQLRNLASREDSGQAFLSSLLGIHPIYANLGIIGLDGKLLASAVPATNEMFLGDRSYFQRATNTLKFSIGEYQVGRITGKPTLNAAYAVREGRTGHLKNVLFAALDLNWISSLIGRADLPEGSTLTIVDRKGTILVRYPDPHRIYTGRTATNLSGTKPRLPSKQEGTFSSKGLDKVPRLYAYTPLTRTEGVADAWVFIGIPSAKVLRNANLLLIQNLTFLGILTLAALTAAWVGGNWFVLRQVRVLLQKTQELAGGNLKARTGIQAAAGELDQLGLSFDQMADAMEQRVLERERAEQDLKALNEQLEQRVEERTSALERSNQDLEQFAYAASHDLQEPLRTVINFLQLLDRDAGTKLGVEGREYLEYSLGGAKRMQQLITDLLNYARLGNKPKVMERIDCEDVLVHVLHNLTAAIEASGADIQHGPLPLVMGDAGQLSLLFQNLLGNALKFKSSRPLKVELSASRQNDAWQFVIQDNGIGIDPKHFGRIFEIFQRLHTREEYPGTGIGLSIAKKIVEAHGGRIWVESTAGQGTAFYFTLQAIPEDTKAKKSGEAKLG